MIGRNAFTLVELLAVVAIIGVLAALIFSGLQSGRKAADRMTETSQMKQIGQAIFAYANDNNHSVPGPLLAGLTAEYNPKKPTELATLLGLYLGVEDVSKKQVLSAMLPPACVRALSGVSANSIRPYVANISMPVNGEATSPWGSTSDASKLPLKLSAVNTATWAFVEADQKNPQVIGQPWAENTPAEPVHGSQRLAWFFDGSVQGVETSTLNTKKGPGRN